MTRKYYEDLIFYQKRLKPNEKRKFRDYIQTQARDLGLKVTINPERKVCKNIVIGDLKAAKYVMCAHYDTTPKLPMVIERNYAFCHNGVSIASLVLGLGLGVMFYFLNLLWIGIIAFLLGVYGFLKVSGIIGESRSFSYNNNTSGIIALLHMMSEHHDFHGQVAYVFIDNRNKGLAGSKALSKMMQQQKMIVEKEDKKFVFFDCIGIGRDFAISWYRETKFVDKLKDLFLERKKEYSIRLKEDSKTDVNDYLSFKRFDHASITCYDMVKKNKFSQKAIKPKKDDSIDLKNIEFVVSIIKEHIEREVENARL